MLALEGYEPYDMGGVEEEFIMLDMKGPTPREEDNLQFYDQGLIVIYEALDPKVFVSIKDLEMAHQVWKRLEDAYWGTSIVKQAKLYIFNDKYAKFKMLEGENVLEMFHCLNNIANELRAHGHKV